VTRERIYWLLISLFALGLVVLYGVYVWPVQREVREERAALKDLRERLAAAYKNRKHIPSRRALDNRESYRAWLELEFKNKVAPFFARSDATLERPLVADPSRLTPPRFKDGYLRRVAEIRANLARRARGIVLAKDLFPRYEWVESGALPDRARFTAIRQDINIRAQVLDLVAQYKGRAVHSLKIEGSRPGDGPWRLIPVTFEAVLPADRATGFVRALLDVTWYRGGHWPLCVLPRRLRLGRPAKPVGGAGGVRIEMEFDVVDFDDSLRQQAAEERKT